MTVTVLDVAGQRLDLTQEMSCALIKDSEMQPGETTNPNPTISLLLTSGALCNDALLQRDEQNRRFSAMGDPTEGALVVAAAKAGIIKSDVEFALRRVAELPFDSDRKRMTTVNQLPSDAALLPEKLRTMFNGYFPKEETLPFIAFTKGSVDGMLDLSHQIFHDGRAELMTVEARARILASNNQLAGTGYQNWQTMTFTTLAFLQIGQALAIRSSDDSLFAIGIASNRLLLGMVALVFLLQAAVIYTPFLQTVFGTEPLPAIDLLMTIGAGA